jgi:hypothetical protein
MNTQMKSRRKIPLDRISRCHPKQTKKAKCLPDSVYADLKKTYGDMNATGCKPGEDHCLLDKASLTEDVKKDLRKQYLRPRRPKAWDSKPDTWLDNFNIMHVMKQYEEANSWFKFLGIFPIDFAAPNPYKKDQQECLYKETCNLNLKDEMAKGIRGIGMIFNLDPHFKGGSHWVGMYINLNAGTPFVGYFDSYGYKPPALIARLMRSFKLQIKECKLGSNARRFQYGGSECGMFSMYFIICMMNGIPFKQFCKDSVNDKFMLELRTILFSK